jgi:hypothetical protein
MKAIAHSLIPSNFGAMKWGQINESRSVGGISG